MSKIEVNTVEPQCGTTLTLGASGDTVALGSGASQTGFGRTGTVDWITTPKVTGDSPITGVTGKGYFLNTTAGTITLNLPAGAAGSIVSMADYAATWQTYNVTVTPNGSEKIGGTAGNATLSTEGQSVTLVYVDSTQGWVNTMDSTSNVRGQSFIVATVSGACNTLVTADTDYKVATFTGPGTFCVSNAGNAAGSNTTDYMVVAGGGAGGGTLTGTAGGAGGGGAGGYRESPGTASGSYTVSPLGVSPAVALPVSVQGYPITVGGGGPGVSNNTGVSGSNSIFSSITSAGGGGGGARGPTDPSGNGLSGGSGGGAGHGTLGGAHPAGTGNTPPVSPPQGNAGQAFPVAGGGGGATAAGSSFNGGAGATSSINATPTARAGGGGGADASCSGSGGAGGGGAGNAACGGIGGVGTINTGSGGGGSGNKGGGGPSIAGGQGGSGVVIIRYKFQ